MVLHPSGGVRRELCGASSVEPVFRHVSFDLVASCGELVDDLHRDRRQIRDPASHRPPVDTQRGGELVAELGLVEVADGLGPVVQRPRIERCPPVVGPMNQVRDHHVSVEMRVTDTRRAMPERGGDEPVTGNYLSATVATPTP